MIGCLFVPLFYCYLKLAISITAKGALFCVVTHYQVTQKVFHWTKCNFSTTDYRVFPKMHDLFIVYSVGKQLLQMLYLNQRNLCICRRKSFQQCLKIFTKIFSLLQKLQVLQYAILCFTVTLRKWSVTCLQCSASLNSWSHIKCKTFFIVH